MGRVSFIGHGWHVESGIPEMSLARALYSVLTWAAQPLLLRKLRRRAVAEPGYGRAVGERFGRYARPIDSLMPPSSTDPLHSFVWIHAVSLGETRAAAILLAEDNVTNQQVALGILETDGPGRIGHHSLEPGRTLPEGSLDPLAGLDVVPQL